MPIKVREGGAWVQVSDGADGASFVTGMIMMFSGTTAPTGWVLCDDSAAAQAANAPDLRDRFVVGAGNNYAVDATGGSADAVVVSHNHTGTVSGGGAHGHTYDRSDAGAGTEGGGQGVHDYNTNTAVSGDGQHLHGVSINPAGSSATNANLPPYYALAFIMKT